MAEQKTAGLFGSLEAFLHRRGRRVWSLSVVETIALTPRLMRLRLKGSDLDELEWRRGQDLVLEIPVAGGGVARRHYTIRDHDAAQKTIAIDFVLHGASPAGTWARNAKPGDRIDAAGPRGRTGLDADADWHLFVGDETGLPAIFAMLEGLDAGAKAHTFIAIEHESEKLVPQTRADVSLEWIVRNGPPAGPAKMLAALERFALPPGHGHACTVGETSLVRAARHHLIARGVPRERIASEGYWRPGRVGGHDHV